MINVIIKFDILIFSRILCGNNFVIPFSLLQIYIYIYSKRLSNRKTKSRSFLQKRTFKEMWRWCLSSYRCAVKFPRSSSVREVEKSILPVCSTAEQEFSPFYCYTRAHTRTHRVVSNDLTSEVGGGGGNCCSNEPETGNGFARGVPMKSARRGKSNVYRLDAAKPRRKWFPVGCLPAGHRYCFVNIIIGRVERRSNGKSMRVISFYGGREKKKIK